MLFPLLKFIIKCIYISLIGKSYRDEYNESFLLNLIMQKEAEVG